MSAFDRLLEIYDYKKWYLAMLGTVPTDCKPSLETAAARNEVVKYVRDLESENARLREAARWIPVGERLPENGVEVLTWNGAHEGMDYVPFFYGVTHWLPKVEPPEDD